MAVAGKGKWSLEDLVDFEVAVATSASVDADVGRRIREELRGEDLSQASSRRIGFKEWLGSKKRGNGARVSSATRLLGVILFLSTFLLGIAVIRGMVVRIEGQAALNIWVLLAGTIGVQWVILLLGLGGYLLARYWIGGLGWLRELVASGVRRLAGRVSPTAWHALIQGKGRQPSALVWRLTRLLQLGGIGFNVGLIGGLFGVLWFTEVAFYWESSLSQFGGESLGQVTRGLAFPWGGSGLVQEDVEALRNLSAETEGPGWRAFFNFIFGALAVWGLLPRLILWIAAISKERSVLAALEFQDIEHRKLWREISRVERAVTMEGMKDGVVLLEVGGMGIDSEAIRPFLLKKLRVNPESKFDVGVLDEAREKEAWEAMREAPCGVVVLVEGWNLSPKELVHLFERVRREAGEETVMRVLVLGDGLEPPGKGEFTQWQEFVDGLRDSRMECVAFEK